MDNLNNSNNELKKSLIKSQKIKPSFIKDNRKNNHITFKNYSKHNNNLNISRKNLRTNTIKLIKKKSSEVNYLDNDNNYNSKEDNSKVDDYEDLFYFFLLHIGKIEYFENILKKHKERKINNNHYFLNIYDSLTGEKTHWNNYYFPKYLYILFYLKSRNLLKEIIKYSISKGKQIMDVINSYNKNYTSQLKIKNWRLKPAEAYLNYEKINQNKKSEIEKSNKNTLSKITNFTDFVIKTDNRGKGKTLIFLGKTINIYIDDLDKYQNKNQGLSMATEASEFNTKVKNEIVYNFDEVALKNRKGNLTVNNKQSHKINYIKNNNFNLDKNKYKKISKTIRNININKCRFKTQNKIINKRDLKKNLFNNYMKQTHKLPLIRISKNKSIENTDIIEQKCKHRDYTFIKTDKNPKELKSNENKKLFRINFNSFSKHYNEEKKRNNKTIINFFSKKDNDFYY